MLDPSSIPLLEAVFEVLSWRKLVAVPPIVYRDGAVHAQLVGATGAVNEIVEAIPDAVGVEVHAVGDREAGFARLYMPWRRSRHAGFDLASGAAAPSDRQREAVLAALALGSYDQPRAATHAEVAEALECAPSTASVHLQKAEAKLVSAATR